MRISYMATSANLEFAGGFLYGFQHDTHVLSEGDTGQKVCKRSCLPRLLTVIKFNFNLGLTFILPYDILVLTNLNKEECNVLKYETGKVSNKGLVVIPIEVRRALSIEEGDRLEITVDDDHAIMNVVKKKSILDVFGMIRTDKAIMPVNEIKQLVKDDIVKDIVAEGRESYE